MKKEHRNTLRLNLRDKSIAERKEIFSKAQFVTEDLSPFRGQMLHYIKGWNKKTNTFVAIGTNYGKICCKKKDVDEWVKIANTDDFFEAGIPFDAEFVKEFGELLFINT